MWLSRMKVQPKFDMTLIKHANDMVIGRQSKLFYFVRRCNSKAMFKFFVLSLTETLWPENDIVLG